MKSNFTQRAITGIVFVVVLVGCILWNPLSFSLLFTLITALSVHEFGHLMNVYNGGNVNRTITALGGAYLFLSVGSFCMGATDARIFLPYLFLLLYLMITELYLKKANPLGNWAFSMLSQLYILAYHNSPEDSSVTYNPILPLSIFVFIWLSDTGAYCVGSLIGKHRLFERISPKKSWEGSIGGAVFSIASSLISTRTRWYARSVRQCFDGYSGCSDLSLCPDSILKEYSYTSSLSCKNYARSYSCREEILPFVQYNILQYENSSTARGHKDQRVVYFCIL